MSSRSEHTECCCVRYIRIRLKSSGMWKRIRYLATQHPFEFTFGVIYRLDACTHLYIQFSWSIAMGLDCVCSIHFTFFFASNFYFFVVLIATSLVCIYICCVIFLSFSFIDSSLSVPWCVWSFSTLLVLAIIFIRFFVLLLLCCVSMWEKNALSNALLFEMPFALVLIFVVET